MKRMRRLPNEGAATALGGIFQRVCNRGKESKQREGESERGCEGLDDFEQDEYRLHAASSNAGKLHTITGMVSPSKQQRD